MADIVTLKGYLEKSISSPLLEADPSYILIKAELENILKQVVKDVGTTIEFLPSEDEGYILLLARKEIYWRLATSVAPEYDVETQFTKILKSSRFDHYTKLIERVQKEIERNEGNYTFVQYADVIIDGRDGSLRNYNLSVPQLINLKTSNITQTSVDLDWNSFDSTASRFGRYEILIGKEKFYDPYEDPAFNKGLAEQQIVITDIKRLKLRIKGLDSNAHYFVVIIYESLSGNIDVAETEITTLAVI
jgi:hypothetical protein